MQYIKCNHCDHIQSEEELLITEEGEEACINCQKTDALMDVEVANK